MRTAWLVVSAMGASCACAVLQLLCDCSTVTHPSSRCRRDAWDGEIFTEFGFNLSSEAKVSVSRSMDGNRERFDIVQDPDGTTWDVLQVRRCVGIVAAVGCWRWKMFGSTMSRGAQAGYGYFKGTKVHCPPVNKVVVELRPPVRGDNWAGKTFLPVRSIVVDIVTRSITSAPNFEPIPCSDAVSVWRHLRSVGPDEESPVVESRRVPYRRIGMAVLNPSKLTLLQRGLLFKVRRRLGMAGTQDN